MVAAVLGFEIAMLLAWDNMELHVLGYSLTLGEGSGRLVLSRCRWSSKGV